MQESGAPSSSPPSVGLKVRDLSLARAIAARLSSIKVEPVGRDAEMVVSDELDCFGNVVLVAPPNPVTCAKAVKLVTSRLVAGAITTREQDLLPSVLKAAAEGLSVVSGQVLELAKSLHEISPRQLDVLTAVVAGLTNEQIAIELCTSETTVKRELAALCRHFGCTSKLALVGSAYEAGFERSSGEAVRGTRSRA